MNTQKYNFEQQIKKQIDEREITPSRDLWSEIEAQSSKNVPSKSKVNWYLIAACFALLLSLGAVFVFDKNEIAQPQIAEKKNAQEKVDVSENNQENVVPLIPEKQNVQAIESKEVLVNKNTPVSDRKEMFDKKDIPLTKENYEQIATEINRNQPSKILAQSDSAKVQVKKKRYVDPSTLLFSVEHKDVIEKSKDGSNVATIDLNTK